MLIHKMRLDEYMAVLDVNSGAVHLVDDVIYDLLDVFDGTNDDESIVEQEASVTPEITEHTEQSEQEVTKAPDEEKQEPMSETNKLGKTISYTIIVLAIAIIAAIAYSIYRRQF